MKYATPMTTVPGATKEINPNTFQQATDKKGRPLWNMPKPSGKHRTQQIGRVVDKSDPKKPKIRLAKQPVDVPVYRGMSAENARYVRSQIRRMRRQQSALGRAASDTANFLNTVLNPLGG